MDLKSGGWRVKGGEPKSGAPPASAFNTLRPPLSTLHPLLPLAIARRMGYHHRYGSPALDHQETPP